MATKTTEVIGLDYELIEKFMDYKGLDYGEVSCNIGYERGSLRRAIRTRHLTKPMYVAFCKEVGVNLDHFNLKDESPDITASKETKNIVDYSKQLEDIMITINKLGNVAMQILEELHKQNKGD